MVVSAGIKRGLQRPIRKVREWLLMAGVWDDSRAWRDVSQWTDEEPI